MAYQTDAEILRAARELIAPASSWIQCEYARDNRGRDVHPLHPNATCWCSLGALVRATGEDGLTQRLRALRHLCWAANVHSITEWNDQPHRKHDEVLAIFDRAIARAEEVKSNEERDEAGHRST